MLAFSSILNIFLNTPGVSIESGFTDTSGLLELPCTLYDIPNTPSPFSPPNTFPINGIAIPLIGKVLGGEKGEGVFGMSYKVQGNSSNPLVSVNPLSILTPGVFRKIFNIEENANK